MEMLTIARPIRRESAELFYLMLAELTSTAKLEGSVDLGRLIKKEIPRQNVITTVRSMIDDILMIHLYEYTANEDGYDITSNQVLSSLTFRTTAKGSVHYKWNQSVIYRLLYLTNRYSQPSDFLKIFEFTKKYSSAMYQLIYPHLKWESSAEFDYYDLTSFLNVNMSYRAVDFRRHILIPVLKYLEEHGVSDSLSVRFTTKNKRADKVIVSWPKAVESKVPDESDDRPKRKIKGKPLLDENFEPTY